MNRDNSQSNQQPPFQEGERSEQTAAELFPNLVNNRLGLINDDRTMDVVQGFDIELIARDNNGNPSFFLACLNENDSRMALFADGDNQPILSSHLMHSVIDNLELPVDDEEGNTLRYRDLNGSDGVLAAINNGRFSVYENDELGVSIQLQILQTMNNQEPSRSVGRGGL